MKPMNGNNILKVLGAVTGLLLVLSCEPTLVVEEGDTTFVADTPSDSIDASSSPSGSLPDPVDPSKVICDPFASNPEHIGLTYDLGVVSNLYYMTGATQHYTSVIDYILNGIPVDTTIYHNKIDVMTRKFDTGFYTQTGILLKNDDGEVLYEYFALDMKTEIRLALGEKPGLYQFALLADDGALLEMDDGHGYRTVVDNDGVHPTQMACASTPVYLDETSSIPAKISYFQGPRYHIAIMMLWREWKETDPAFSWNDPTCGKRGNGVFFDYNTSPSTPKKTFVDFLDRGWKIVGEKNFHLPRQFVANPCRALEPVNTVMTSVTPVAAVTNVNSIQFSFSSNKIGATYQCSLDGGAAVACVSPYRLTDLADGAHQFSVWATDQGKTDSVGASYSWTIDTRAPILSTITYLKTSTSITITWTTSEPTTTLVRWGTTQDMPNAVPENSVYETNHSVTLSSLNPGTIYYFSVGGKDAAGNSFTSNRYGTMTPR